MNHNTFDKVSDSSSSNFLEQIKIIRPTTPQKSDNKNQFTTFRFFADANTVVAIVNPIPKNKQIKSSMIIYFNKF